MIFTKKEIKEKTIEEIFHLIDSKQDILITDNKNSYYKHYTMNLLMNTRTDN